MTETMIERVARAIYELDPAEDQETDLDGRPLGKPYPITWDSISELDAPAVGAYRELARAAIEAMREPTEAMKHCNENVHWGYGCGVCGGLTEGWYAMIDSALTEGEVGK